MNMTQANYPYPGAYVRWWQKIKALPDNAPITHPRLARAAYANLPTSAPGLKANFLDALHRRINARGKLDMNGRRYQESYLIDLFRDQFDLRAKVRSRTVVRQFRTDIVQKRFGHLQEIPVVAKAMREWRTKRSVKVVAYRLGSGGI